MANSRPIEMMLAASAPLALGIAGGASAALHAAFGRSRICFDCPRLQIDQVEHFGPEFDELWDRLKHNYAVTMERTAAFLNWRHSGLPRLLGRSHVLACRSGGELLGYVVVREPVNTVPGHFILCDLFYDPGHPSALHNLLNGAFEFAVARSASVFEVFGFHPSLNRELQTQHPYVLRRTQLERLGRDITVGSIVKILDPRGRSAASSTYWYRAPDPELERICSSGAWWPSGIDGDLNL